MQQRIAKAPHHAGQGEAPEVLVQGVEVSTVEQSEESPVGKQTLLEEMLSRDNLKRALQRVKSNGGAAGIDKMTVKELSPYLKQNWEAIKEQLLNGSYKPKPVRRVEIPKPDGGVRCLGIPCCLDRLIQQAMLQMLQGYWDPTFSDTSYGFRPKRSAHEAVAKAQEHIGRGYAWVVDLDLEKFFDRVNHDRLMAKIAERVKDKRVLKLIRAFLNSGVMEDGLVSPTDEGTPQGGPLSPWLSNVVLDELDRELAKRGHRHVRYADDCNIYVRSEKAGKRVMTSITRFITKKLKLKVNEAKSAVDKPWNRKFLGFTFSNGGYRRGPRRKIAPKAIKRFKDKIRQSTSRTGGRNIKQVIAGLIPYLRGWYQYFRFTQSKQDFEALDKWIKRKLRCMIWKQWGTRKKRYRELVQHGVRTYTAWVTMKSGHGPWRISRSPAVQQVLTASFFKTLGLPSLTEAYVLSSRRTAHYGPV
jgi:RNA-directed DNA polymerase